MNFRFACPFPCSRIIYVEASDIEDAVQKIIEVGGLACRNGDSYCAIAHPQMSPLPDPRLRDLIRSFMEEEDLVVRDRRVIEAYIGQGIK